MESFRPLGQESRDIGQFVDDDGAAYLIFTSRPTHGFFIAKLSDDYLSIDKEVSFIPVPLEGGALVHHRGQYYSLVLTSPAGIAMSMQSGSLYCDSVICPFTWKCPVTDGAPVFGWPPPIDRV